MGTLLKTFRAARGGDVEALLHLLQAWERKTSQDAWKCNLLDDFPFEKVPPEFAEEVMSAFPECFAEKRVAWVEYFGSSINARERPKDLEVIDVDLLSVTDGFVVITPGTFLMGSPATEDDRNIDEAQHTVTLTKAFELKATPVTEKDWRELMGNNPSSVFTNRPAGESADECPVQRVNWLDAVAFCNKLSERAGLKPYYILTNEQGTPGIPGYLCNVTVNPAGKTGYRLPTEAEWEYATRAGSNEVRYGDLDQIAWHIGNSGDRTHPVGQKRANAFGLFDMLGHVYEWTSDWYGYYATDAQVDPQGPSTGSERVARGGRFDSDACYVRAAFRCHPGPRFSDYFIGFRPARSF